MNRFVKISEKVTFILTMLWLAFNALFSGPPGEVLCELCEDLNHQLRIAYLVYFPIMFIITAIIIWYLIKPIKVLRIISWIIVLSTIVFTILMISGDTHSFWGVISDCIQDSYLST